MQGADSKKPYFVIFGDSLSDNGNVEIVTHNFPLWQNRYSNGPVWTEYYAYYNNATLINFAIGGATTNNATVEKYTEQVVIVPTIDDQIAMFADVFVEGKDKKSETFKADVLANDIAIIQIGSNDILKGLMLEATNSIDVEEYTSAIAHNILGSINNVKALGFQKVYVWNIPDIKHTPLVRVFPEQAQENISKYSITLNFKIAQAISDNFDQSDDKYVKVIDFYNILNFAIENFSEQLNIKIVDKAHIPLINYTQGLPVGNSDDYVFNDWVHPTTKVHAFTGAVISEIINNPLFTLEPASIEPLITKYNINEATSRTNFLYNDNSYGTGILNIDSYSIKSATASAQDIISIKNKKLLL